MDRRSSTADIVFSNASVAGIDTEMTTMSRTNTARSTPTTRPDSVPKTETELVPESDPRTEPESQSEQEFPTGFKLASIFIGIIFAVFCTGLDRSIIATAIPKITTEFNSLDDVGWYGSAYLLAACCFQLMVGKLYAEFNIKWMFLGTLLVFEVGSVICAAAPNSTALIVGRAVAGLGSAGLATGAILILAFSVPLHNRPKFTGAISAGMGVAQVVGPFLGGVFTDKATWRWCFWINLPIGGITAIVVLLLVKLPDTKKTSAAKNWREFLDKFDFLGTIFLVPSLVCLLLALQWGGTTYAWSSWRCILLLCIFAVTIIIWVFVQIYQGDKATVPLRILKMRSMIGATWFLFCLFGALYIVTYYVSIWFQAVRDTSAFHAGINFLTTTVALSITAVLAGFLTSTIGYYNPQMITGVIITAVATGLITRFDVDTSTGYWIASLILFGLGIGTGAQQSLMVPQTILEGGDISLGTSILIFAQTLCGSVFLSVCENIFQEKLLSELMARVPSVDARLVVKHGASGLKSAMSQLYSPNIVQGILDAYAKAMRNVWIVAVVLVSAGVLGVPLIEWKSVKKNKNPKKAASGNETEEDMKNGQAAAGSA